MHHVTCSHHRHAAAILDIFNEAICNSTALYDYHARTLDSMTAWFKTKETGQFPVIGIENDAGELMGFASYGTFRAWPAYKYSVEHSVYVHKDHRGKGLGTALLEQLLVEAHRRDCHVLVGAIDARNHASVALHEKLGFVHAGTIRQVAFKFGMWLDLDFYQRILATPGNPIDA